MSRGNLTAPAPKLQENTGSPVWSERLIAELPWCNFWLSWLWYTWEEISGFRWSRLVLRCRFISNYDGITPVVQWGVVRYLKSRHESLVSRFPSCSLCSPDLTPTEYSAKPLEAWCCRQRNLCLISFLRVNLANSELKKHAPLSPTITLCKPCVAKRLNFSIVPADVVPCVV